MPATTRDVPAFFGQFVPRVPDVCIVHNLRAAANLCFLKAVYPGAVIAMYYLRAFAELQDTALADGRGEMSAVPVSASA